jgi:hypothetical protein
MQPKIETLWNDISSMLCGDVEASRKVNIKIDDREGRNMYAWDGGGSVFLFL